MAYYVDIHTHQKITNAKVVGWYNASLDDIDTTAFFSIGIHPLTLPVTELTTAFLQLEKLVKQDNCKAIGECGLDPYSKAPMQVQLTVLEQHIFLSKKYNKPLLIHCVKRFDLLQKLYKKHAPLQPWIIHGFVKNKLLANSLISQGFYLCFGRHLLRNKTVQDTFAQIDISRIFLETDACDVTSIKAIYTKAAALRQISVVALQQQIIQQFNKIQNR